MIQMKLTIYAIWSKQSITNNFQNYGEITFLQDLQDWQDSIKKKLGVT